MSTTPSPTSRAEVIGAGIAGLAAAAALARQGWQVRVHEREPDIRAFGSGIYLWSNGLRVLDDLGVLERAIDGAHYGGAIETRNQHDQILARIPTNGPGQAQVLTILREQLIDALVHAATDAGVDLQTGSTALYVDPDGTTFFSDGRSSQADLVVVADGVGSRLRDGLGVLKVRRSLGQRCARVLIPRAPDLVEPDHAGNYIEWMSGRRFLLYTPSSETQAYIALVCPSQDLEALGDPLPRHPWLQAFPFAENILRAIDSTPRWDSFERIDLLTWSAGKVAVLGDAAHAQPPYLGQGGGCALMSAMGLAHQVTHGQGTLTEQLRRWERIERPLITHTQRFAYGVGRLNDVPELPRNVLLRALGRSKRYGRSRLRAATAQPTPACG